MSEAAAERLIEECKAAGLGLTFLPQHYGLLGPGIELNRLAELPVLDFRFSDPPRSTVGMKSVMDVTISALMLILLSPLLIAIAIAILIDSGRPVLFRQQRAGRDGRPFTMLKFRTMVADAEERLAELVDLEKLDEPAFKIPDDPRVTRIGRVLRRSSLDELPQLINVLRGSMSLVGPRPEEEAVVAIYDERQRPGWPSSPGSRARCRSTGAATSPSRSGWRWSATTSTTSRSPATWRSCSARRSRSCAARGHTDGDDRAAQRPLGDGARARADRSSSPAAPATSAACCAAAARARLPGAPARPPLLRARSRSPRSATGSSSSTADVRDIPDGALDGVDGVINLSGLSQRPDRRVRPRGQLADERDRHRDARRGVRRARDRALRVRLVVLALRRAAAGHARRGRADRAARRLRDLQALRRGEAARAWPTRGSAR